MRGKIKVNEKKISIITVCYNSEKTIRETFESVLKQEYSNYEYIVIDGKSKDKTVEIIEEYMEKFNGKMQYISEEDNGIYDAMNKGIEISTGEIVGLLNSDDYYIDKNTLKKINKNFTNDIDGTYSNIIMLEDHTLNIPERKLFSGEGNYHFGWVPIHPTLYLKKYVYEDIGIYNQKYPISADYEFMIKLLKSKKYKLKYINDFLVCMRSGGASTDGLKGRIDSLKEAYHALKENKVRNALFIIICKFGISGINVFKAIIANIYIKSPERISKY